MDPGTIASFMEITSCGSQTTAVQHLASCNWRIEAAIELYFTAGAADEVRDPIPARSETLYNEHFASDAGDQVRPPIPARSETLYNEHFASDAGDQVRAPIPARSDTLYYASYAASSSRNPYAASSSTASSIWAAKTEESPSGRSVPAVHVQVPSVPEVSVTEWEHDGDNGGGKEEDTNGSEGAEADEGDAYGEEEEEEEDYGDEDMMGMEEEDSHYGTKDSDDDYLMQPEDSDSDNNDMEAAFAAQSPSRRRAETSLNDLFRPPYELMFGGSFHEAKMHAARQDRWLLINLQARGVFASHMHNRDLWSNEVISQVISSNFIFSLMEKTAAHGDEGSKVCCFYKLGDDQLPAVLVLDPITGQLLSKWCGSLQADDFLTYIGKYTESKPSSLYKPKIIPGATTATPKSNQSLPDAQEPAPVATWYSQEPVAPVAPKLVDEIESTPAVTVDYGEPTEGEKICRVRVRFPSGDVVTREFGSTRKVATLFAYCGSVVQGQAGKEQQAFRIMMMAGRAFEELRGVDASFEDLGLNFSTVSVVLIA